MEGIKKAFTCGIITKEEAVSALGERFGMTLKEALAFLAG